MMSTEVTFRDMTDMPHDLPQTENVVFPSQPAQQAIVGPLASQVSKDELKKNMEKFCSHPHRASRRAGSQASMVWLKGEIDGIIASLPQGRRALFTTQFIKISGYEAESLIVNMKGSSDENVIIGAHSDDVGHPQAGADDNASGTVTILEAFRIIAKSNFNPKRSTQFHFYTAEESGLIGSAQIARSYKSSGKRVYAMLQHDMVGYHRPGAALEAYVVNVQTNGPLTTFLRTVIREYGKGITKFQDYNRGYGSDHISWNSQGYASSCWKEYYFSPQYHSAQDKPQFINYDLLQEFTRVAIGFAIELSLAA
jgi:leucyl aminopeptidase